MFLLLVCHTCLLYTSGPPALAAIIVVLEARRGGGLVSRPSGNAGGTPPSSTPPSKSKSKVLWWRGRARPVDLCPQRILTPAPPPPPPPAPPHVRHRPTTSGRHHLLLSPLLLLLLLLPLLPLPRGEKSPKRSTPPSSHPSTPGTTTRMRARCCPNGARPHPSPRQGTSSPLSPPPSLKTTPSGTAASLLPRPPGGDSDYGDDDDNAAFFTALATPSTTTPLSYPPQRNAASPLSMPHPDWDGRTPTVRQTQSRQRRFRHGPCISSFSSFSSVSFFHPIFPPTQAASAWPRAWRRMEEDPGGHCQMMAATGGGLGG